MPAVPNSKSFPRTPGEIYGIVALSMDEVMKTEFGTAGIFKVPSNRMIYPRKENKE